MNRALSSFCFALCLSVSCLVAAPAAALDPELGDIPPGHKYISSERMTLELRVGPYQPDMGSNRAFKTFFHGDHGPLVGFELDVIGYRIPEVLYLSGGVGVATAHFDGKTVDETSTGTAEATSLSYLPLDLLAVARFDMLARKYSIPFIVTGKLGYEWAYWVSHSGALPATTGWSVGLRWGAQIALDLDTFDKKAARNMDEEWGINHSFVFFELFGFEPSKRSLPLGNTAWTAGLGFVF